MTLDWAEQTFPELFPEETGKHFPAIEYEGIIYSARAYSETLGFRYLGITPDGGIYGIGDFTEYTLQQFETVDHWSDQVLTDLSWGVVNILDFTVQNDPLENSYDSSVNWHSDQNMMGAEPIGGTPIIDQWFGA